MDLMMNGLLIAATLFAGGYCWVLARRVQDLKSLDRGLGGSIVSLTRQVELARLTLDEARAASKETRQDLGQLVGRADTAARELRLLIAAAPVMPAPPAHPNGAIFQASAGYAALYEGTRARRVGDPLTITLVERTVAHLVLLRVEVLLRARLHGDVLEQLVARVDAPARRPRRREGGAHLERRRTAVLQVGVEDVGGVDEEVGSQH